MFRRLLSTDARKSRISAGALALSFALSLSTAMAVRADVKVPYGQLKEEPSALRRIAFDHYLSGDQDTAFGFYEKAAQLAAHEFGEDSSYVGELYFEMGSLALDSKKFQKAETYLEQAVKHNPNSLTGRLKLAKLLEMRGKPADAFEQIRQAMAKHPNSAEAHEACFRFLETHNSPALALREASYVSRVSTEHPVIPQYQVASAALPETAAPEPATPTLAALKHLGTKDAKNAKDQKDSKDQKDQKDQKDLKDQKDAKELKDGKGKPVEQKSGKQPDTKSDASKKSGDAAAKSARDKKERDRAERERKDKEKRDREKKEKHKKKPYVAPNTVATEVPLEEKAEPLASLKTTAKAMKKQTPVMDNQAGHDAPTENEVASSHSEAPARAEQPAPAPTLASKPKAGRHSGGLIPPPPPTVPGGYGQVVAYPPPQRPKPKPAKPKETEKPAADSGSEAAVKPSSGSEQNDDFLLDWAGTKSKKRR